ncbi:MAG: DNA-protecting protein DprA [Planctomycetes bacterium]|nr:DNA-protecting protein DprA [Planctomycetota bacterium]
MATGSVAGDAGDHAVASHAGGAGLVDENTRAAVLLNSVSGLGPVTYGRLEAAFGEPRAMLAAPREKWERVPRMEARVLQQVFDERARLEAAADDELRLAAEHTIRVFRRAEKGFPAPLRHLPDPPILVYALGEYRPEDAVAVAMVGSRHCTFYGRAQAERLARELAARGVTVVSGLARGIDARAHFGALEGGGRTVAVLGCGLLRIYPPEHEALAGRIASAGAIFSELPLAREPDAGNFPRRNRLISGLSLGVIVVEAADRSGSLITARWALEQGKEVFAVPGPVDKVTSRGTNRLIKEGAKLVENADDVLEELGEVGRLLSRQTVSAGPGADTGAGGATASADGTPPDPFAARVAGDEATVLAVFQGEPLHVDEVARAVNLSVGRVQVVLTMLEMKRLVERFPGSRFARKA